MHRDIFSHDMYAGQGALRQTLVRTLIASPYKTCVPGFTKCSVAQLAEAMGYCQRRVRAELNKLAAEGELVMDYWKTGFLLLEDMKRCPPRTMGQTFRWGNVLHYLSQTTQFVSFTKPLLDLVQNSAPHLYQGFARFFRDKFLVVRHYLDGLKIENNVNNKVHAPRPVDNSGGLVTMAQLPLIEPVNVKSEPRSQKPESTAANCARRLRELLGLKARPRAPEDARDFEVWWCHGPGTKGRTRSGKGVQWGIFREWIQRGVSLAEVQDAVGVALMGGRLGPQSCLLAYANGILKRRRM
jgi:hypothetical protein